MGHHSMGILQVRKTRAMKLFVVLAAVASVALADKCPPCPTPEETGADCRENEMLCQRDPGPGAAACECPRYTCEYKVWNDKPQCANHCRDDRCESGSVCPDTYDSMGCLMPMTCAPSVRDYGHYGLDIKDGYTWDQVIEACPKSQYDSSGCPIPPRCADDQKMCMKIKFEWDPNPLGCPLESWGYCVSGDAECPIEPWW